MDDWVTTKEASLIKKVGLTQHRIAELAKQGKVDARRTGTKKWLVKVTLTDGKYDLVRLMDDVEVGRLKVQARLADKPRQEPADSLQSKQKHCEELSIAALTLAANFEAYLNNIGPSLDKIGDFVYGLYEDSRYGMGMRKVDKSGALNLLYHLKTEFLELANVTDWADLTPGDTINDNLIVQLQLKAHKGNFSGKCPACPH